MSVKLVRGGPLAVIDYRCEAGPDDVPYLEAHTRYSLSYVRRGSFGCRCLGREHQLLAGGFLIGRPGDEFTCTHEHHGGGDECLSIQLAPDLLSELADEGDVWRLGALAPDAGLSTFGELVQASLADRVDISLAESALALVARFLALKEQPPALRRADARLRRLVCRTADWVDANSAEDIDLLDAAGEAGLSPYYFLRSFRAVLGLTPHQHLLRCRLRKAAHALLETDAPVTEVAMDVGFGDLSNFVRSFRRAAGVSPGRFRGLARGGRKNFQESVPSTWLAAAL